MEYEQYLALCPGLSDPPSPANTNGLPFSFSDLNSNGLWLLAIPKLAQYTPGFLYREPGAYCANSGSVCTVSLYREQVDIVPLVAQCALSIFGLVGSMPLLACLLSQVWSNVVLLNCQICQLIHFRLFMYAVLKCAMFGLV